MLREKIRFTPAIDTMTSYDLKGRIHFMSEARWGKRFEQRLEATYGTDHCDERGYVYDISPFGLFLSGDRFYPSGTRLRIKIELDNGSRVEFEGSVCWGKEQERPDWFDREAGMGIKISRFFEGELFYQDYVLQLCATHKKRTPPLR